MGTPGRSRGAEPRLPPPPTAPRYANGEFLLIELDTDVDPPVPTDYVTHGRIVQQGKLLLVDGTRGCTAAPCAHPEFLQAIAVAAKEQGLSRPAGAGSHVDLLGQAQACPAAAPRSRQKKRADRREAIRP